MAGGVITISQVSKEETVQIDTFEVLTTPDLKPTVSEL